MSARRRLRRLVIGPAVVCVVAGSLSIVGQSSTATAATEQSGTHRTIHLRGQTSAYPKAGPVGRGQAANLTEEGALARYSRSHSPRPATKRTATGGRALASPNVTWVPTVTPVPVHSSHTG